MSKLSDFIRYVEAACEDPNVGYSQTKRTTIKLNSDKRTYCDCSSLISWAMTKAGFYSSNPWFYTGNEEAELKKAGWKRYNPNNVEWKQGDILHRRSNGSGHTEVVYKGTGTGQGITMGAHGSLYSWANQVNVNKYISYGRNWQNLYRYEGNSSGTYSGTWPTLPKRGYFDKGDKGVNVGRVQSFLVWAGYDVGKYGIDNVYGWDTAAAVSAFEKDHNLEVDGQFGPVCLKTAKKVTR